MSSSITLKGLLANRRPAALVVKYVVFALIAIGVNLGSQWIVKQLYEGPLAIYAALIVGTGAGLVAKYILDKRYIFFYSTRSAQHNAMTFLLYTFMGVVTTAIFWGSELLFHFAFPDPNSAYLGGLIGLSVGYATKFLLDRRWVFG